MTARSGRALALLIAAALAGCGPLPLSTVPASATPDQPAGARVAICYNELHTVLGGGAGRGTKECPAGAAAELVDTDYLLQYCPLLLPARATFVCVPAK